MKIAFGFEKQEIFHPPKFITPEDEIYLLKPGDIIKSSGTHKIFKHYEFIVDSDQFDYVIKSWPADNQSDTDIYINNNTEKATQSNHQWKDTTIGIVKAQIHPSDPHFRLGKFSLGVLPYKEQINTYYLSFEKNPISDFQ